MPFIILALMVVALAAVSFLPDAERIYTSPVFVAGWAVLAAWSLCVIVSGSFTPLPAPHTRKKRGWRLLAVKKKNMTGVVQMVSTFI